MVRRIVVLTAMLLTTISGVAFAAADQQSTSAKQNKTTVTAAAPVNINTASSTDLEKLPGVGPAMAQRIVEYRQKNSGFKKIEDLMQVKGIGEKKFLRLKPLVTIASRTTDR